jgi:hypothetical protein
VEFDKAFWPADVGVFIMATEDKEEAGFLQTWVNLHRLTSKPMLVGTVVGAVAESFENMTDDEVKSKG